MGQIYNKAIRDKIPEIIRQKGEDCIVETLSDEQFLLELEKKLKEELDEYLQSKSPEELADLIEVIYRISELRGVGKEHLEEMRYKKAEARGAFEKNLFLKETREKTGI